MSWPTFPACTSLALRALRRLGWCGLLAACGAMAPQGIGSNRPDGEGYAGRGELVIRLVASDHDGVLPLPLAIPGLAQHKTERSTVELRYLGLDEQGRAAFQRHDVDTLAGPPQLPAGEAAAVPAELGSASASHGAAASDPPDTRRILVDLRLSRQIQIQGKIIEIVEATASGVVFRIY
jgi:hypothetical protein